MDGIILETERLSLREFNLQDTDFIIALVNSPGWIRYIGDRNIHTTQQAINYLENGPIRSYGLNGFGLWMVVLKHANEPIGMCGLIKRPDLANLDVGFALLQEYTGQGYAYEAAKATLQYGFDHLHQEKLAAITLPENQASVRLLEKLGFTYAQTITRPETGQKLLLYELEKTSWL